MIERTFSAAADLILIVDPEAGIRVRNSEVISLVGVNVERINELLVSVQAIIRPLYGVNEEWIKSRTYSSESLMGEGQPLDLSIFYKITAPNDQLRSLVDPLAKLSFIQSAYIKPRATLPFIDEGYEESTGDFMPPGPTDDLTRFQEYLNSPDVGGINARYAWNKEGGRGNGIKLIDIEGAWRFSHEDLKENLSGCVGGVLINSSKWRKHGTMVLGVLGGDNNGFGVTGICPAVDVRAISIFANSKGEPSPEWDSAAAIRLAADLLCPGDIILIELHRAGPAVGFQENEHTQEGYIPIEWWPCDMAAILYATKRGILVVEAGGNGRENLCDDIYNDPPAKPYGPFPHWWSNPFKRAPIDTQAILVGAGLPPPETHGVEAGPDRSRWEHSNYGKVIDVQGWGIEVATCGGNNDLNGMSSNSYEDTHYTSRFNGTSSASSMIAGVLGCLQGVLRTEKKTLTPSEARALLRNNDLGYPQQDGPSGPADLEPIGPRPDLKKLIEHF